MMNYKNDKEENFKIYTWHSEFIVLSSKKSSKFITLQEALKVFQKAYKDEKISYCELVWFGDEENDEVWVIDKIEKKPYVFTMNEDLSKGKPEKWKPIL